MSSIFWTTTWAVWRWRALLPVAASRQLLMAPRSIRFGVPVPPGSSDGMYVLVPVTMSMLMTGAWTAREVKTPERNKAPPAMATKKNTVAAVAMVRNVILTLPMGCTE